MNLKAKLTSSFMVTLDLRSTFLTKRMNIGISISMCGKEIRIAQKKIQKLFKMTVICHWWHMHRNLRLVVHLSWLSKAREKEKRLFHRVKSAPCLNFSTESLQVWSARCRKVEPKITNLSKLLWLLLITRRHAMFKVRRLLLAVHVVTWLKFQIIMSNSIMQEALLFSVTWN